MIKKNSPACSSVVEKVGFSNITYSVINVSKSVTPI